VGSPIPGREEQVSSVKTLFYSLFIFVIALLVLISFFLGGFLGELKNVENICGDCKGGLSASGYQVCVGEYIVFECKGDGWTKAFEVKGRGQNLTNLLDFGGENK